MAESNWSWNANEQQNNDFFYGQPQQQYESQWQNPPPIQQNPTVPLSSNIPQPISQDYYNQPNAKHSNINYQQPNVNHFEYSGKESYGSQNFPQQFISDPVLSMARQIGGQFAKDHKEKLTEFLSNFQLKYYFAVDNSYVGKKLAIVMFPFLHKKWNAERDISGQPLPPKSNVNAPDLYIPLMAFITFSLISGFVLGVQGRFSPEHLGITTTNALVYLFFENVVILIMRYLMNILQELSIWHTLAYSSYKYIGMNLSLLAVVCFDRMAYYCVLAYMSFAVVFFLLRTVRTFVLDVKNMYASDSGCKRKLYLLLYIASTQPLLMWLLTRGIASAVSNNMNIAQMALSGIGLARSTNSAGLPLQLDGEIDYEAILKAP